MKIYLFGQRLHFITPSLSGFKPARHCKTSVPEFSFSFLNRIQVFLYHILIHHEHLEAKTFGYVFMAVKINFLVSQASEFSSGFR